MNVLAVSIDWYHSLEEMDTIFQKTTSVFNCVSVARNEPRRYGKNGEVLVPYEETDEAEIRRQSTSSQGKGNIKREAVDMEMRMENGKLDGPSEDSSCVDGKSG